jgi:adenylate cyclase
VNIASRLEGLTKEYGAQILVTESMVKAAPGFVYREMDKVAVKGRVEGISIFEPLGKVGEVAEAVVDEAYLYEKALGHYRAQRWGEADRMLVGLQEASPKTKVYKLLRDRIAIYKANPPGENWNGVWVFTTK